MNDLHDVVAIGCGPFNLGLAALGSTVPGLDLVVLEAESELRWHPGVMFEDARLQLSFLADLVTLIDPTHPLSFLAYIRESDRMYPFFIRQEFHPTRLEYEAYLRWAASKLPSVRFAHRVERVQWDAGKALFEVHARRSDGTRSELWAKDVVIGIGTQPTVPQALAGLPPERLVHSADYLRRQPAVRRAKHVTVIGSGQSGAEVAVDLLRHNLGGGGPVSWLTRTRAFAPLDFSKLVLEMTTPEYIHHFHGLPSETRDRLVKEQWQHYKGISSHTLDEIHDLLYHRELKTGLSPVELRCGIAVEAARLSRSGEVVLTCRQGDTGESFEHSTDLVIAATGYRERQPMFLEPLEPLVRRDDRKRYRVRLDYSVELDPSVTGRVFVVNAELHTHGVATPDLGVSPFRNATILNALTGREVYRLPRRTAFSRFGLPTPAAPLERPAAHAPAAPRRAPRLTVLARQER